MRSVQNNIRLLYILQALRYFLVMIPVLVVFYQSIGLSMQDIMVVQAVFSGAIVLLEIPSGYFSDIIGRRTTMIIGTTMSTVGFIAYCFAYNMWTVLLAELCIGIGASFISGTDSALMFDTLAELGSAERSIQSEGKQISFGNFSESLAGVTGGLLAAISLRLPLYVEACVIALTIPLAFLLVEPKRHAFRNSRASFRGIWEISRWAIVEHPRLRWFILYSGLVGAATLTMVWFIQPIFQKAGIPIAYFGFAWTALNISVGYFSMNAHRIESKIGEQRLVSSLILFTIVGYFVLGYNISLITLPALLVFYLVRGINNPVFNTYINRLVGSDRRATVLSVRQLVTRGVFCLIGPAAGWVADAFSLQTALLSCGVIFLLAGIGMLLCSPYSNNAMATLPEAEEGNTA